MDDPYCIKESDTEEEDITEALKTNTQTLSKRKREATNELLNPTKKQKNSNDKIRFSNLSQEMQFKGANLLVPSISCTTLDSYEIK